jgi:membrane-associated phospholipid phosphatase
MRIIFRIVLAFRWAEFLMLTRQTIGFWRLAAILIVVLVISGVLDSTVVGLLGEPGKLASDHWLARFFKAPGDFRFTLVVVVAVFLLQRRKLAFSLILLGPTVGALYPLTKWAFGRTRPFKGVDIFDLEPFRHGLAGILNLENLSFPSGHATLAFATAHVLAIYLPRWRMAFYGGAILVGLERVLEGAHYPSDIAGAAIFGILMAHLAIWLSGIVFTQSSLTLQPSCLIKPEQVL